MNRLSNPSYGLLAGAAILSALAVMSFGLEYLILFSLAPLLIFLAKREKLSELLFGVFIFELVFAVVALAFIPEPLFLIHVALIFSLAGFLMWWIKIASRFLDYRLPEPICLLIAAVLAGVFRIVQAEISLIPSHIIDLGATLAPTIFLPLSFFGGLWVLILTVVLSNFFVAWILSAKLSGKSLRTPLVSGTIFAVLLMVGILWGRVAIPDYPPAPAGSPRFAAVSVYKSELDKEEKFGELIEDLENAGSPALKNLLGEVLTSIERTVASYDVKAVFLPEDLVDVVRYSDTHPEAYRKYGISNNGTAIDLYAAFAGRNGVWLTVGLTTVEEGDKKYNSILVFSPEGNIADIYHKSDLVIGSEYWPFGGWVPPYWRLIWKISPAAARLDNFPGGFETAYSASARPHSTVLLNGYRVGTPICLEGQLPRSVKGFLDNGAEFLINSSNNDWMPFNNKIYARMILNVTRINSVYFGVPIIINGKDNYVGLIYPDGRTDVIWPEDQDMAVWVDGLPIVSF